MPIIKGKYVPTLEEALAAITPRAWETLNAEERARQREIQEICLQPDYPSGRAAVKSKLGLSF